MRIAIVTIGFKPFRASGMDVGIERLVGALLNANQEVTIISGIRQPQAEIFKHPLFKIYRIPFGRTDWIGYSFRVAKFLHSLEPFDIVHFGDVHFAWLYRGRYVTYLHHSFRERLASLQKCTKINLSWPKKAVYYTLARKFAEIPALKRARGFLAISNKARGEFINSYHIDPRRIVVTRNGIDTEFFHHVYNSDTFRQTLGIKVDDPVILFAGFITPRKGLETLIKAFPLIQPIPKLLIVGRWRNEAYRNKMMRSLREYRKHVVETGFVPDEQMPSMYSIANLSISTSLLEGFGLPMAESLACETPIVATEGGALPEVVGPGGIIVPAQNPNELAGTISSLLQDPVLCKKIGKLGREHIQTEFSVPAMVESMLNAYDKFM